MKVYVASSNLGKLAELQAIFAESPLELHAYEPYVSPPEDAADYLGNALIKARALSRQLRVAGIAGGVLADDSGLEVAALDGRPGIFSARFAGPDATWETRRSLLHAELRGVAPQQRGARFVCAIALILADGSQWSGAGSVAGTIVDPASGKQGFGFDPVFFYPPRGCTFAELSAQEKNAISHRRAAAQALLAQLRGRV